MRTEFIYGIKQVNLPEIRYVGKTDNLKRRMKAHINIAKSGKLFQFPCYVWMKAVLDANKSLEMVVLKEIKEGEDWKEWEVYFIAKYRDINPITNVCDGGGGGILIKNHKSSNPRGIIKERGIKFNHPQKGRRDKVGVLLGLKGELNGNWGNGAKIAGIKNSQSKQYKVTCLDSGSVLIMESQKDMFSFFKVQHITFNKNIKDGVFRGYKVEHISKMVANILLDNNKG